MRLDELGRRRASPNNAEYADAVLIASGHTDFVLANVFTPVSITGAGSDSDVLMGQVDIPEGVVGRNSALIILPAWQWTNNANTKTFDAWVGQSLASKTSVYNRGRTTNAAEVPIIQICNRGVLNSQVLPLSANPTYGTNIATAPETRTIDFSLPGMKVLFTGRLQNTADSLTLNGYAVIIRNPGR
jgi:hypothetical protein